MASLWELLGQTWPARLARSAVDAAALPGDVYAGRVDPLSEEGIGKAADLAGMVMGGAYPAAPRGAVGVFGGRLAKTADQAALTKAEEMAAAGAPREAIWNDTGWFQGADQKWRFEIPDTAAKMNPNSYSGGLPDRGALQPIAGQMWHPDVYAAYPDVRRAGMLVERQAEPSGVYSSANASRTGDETLKIFAPTTEEARSVALHEMQHAIQQREGFTPGANPTEILRGYKNIVRDYEDQIVAINEQLKRAQGTPRYNDLMQMRQELVNEIQKLQGPHGIGLQERATNEYKRDFGEVEARNVQSRRDMTSEQRRATPPWATEDIPTLRIGNKTYD